MLNDQTKDVEEANIRYHTTLAKEYDRTQPHFKPENQKQVETILKELSERTGGKSLLDLGCGTGFILFLAHPYFQELHGVDITPAMMEQANLKFKQANIKNVKLCQASTDSLPFSDFYFDVITGYSFLHHLPILLPTLSESYRVLRKGGVFFSDLDPNFYFWDAIKKVAKEKDVSDLLKIDINSICNMLQEVQALSQDLDVDTIRKAEYIEGYEGGFKEETMKQMFFKAGFREVNLEYHWFWQEGRVIADLSVDSARYLERHLQLALPLTKNLFKYIRILAIK